MEHVLSCPKGGFPIIRHNEVKDFTANLMTKVCHDVCVEPNLQPITGEVLSHATAISDDATVPEWTLQQMVSGVVALNELSLM